METNHFYSNHRHATEAGMTGHDVRRVAYQQLDNEAISDEQSIISHGAINGTTTMWRKLLPAAFMISKGYKTVLLDQTQ